jgi:hypothetical protein
MERLQCIGFAAGAVCIYLAQAARLGVFAAGNVSAPIHFAVFAAVVVPAVAVST